MNKNQLHSVFEKLTLYLRTQPGNKEEGKIGFANGDQNNKEREPEFCQQSRL